MADFTDFDLSEQLVANLHELDHITPTPIQEVIIPIMLTGQDVIGQAQTGTGKTAAFALPILQQLNPQATGVQALVLTPTRELAMQVANNMHTYGKGLNAHVLAIYGGQAYTRQVSELRKGANIVVGTPGRLIDLIEQKKLDLSSVRTVVLDEADEMLSMGFLEEIETILAATPGERQTALFSATMPAGISNLAEKYLKNPQRHSIGPQNQPGTNIDQRYYMINERDKIAALTRLFETENISRAIIFARTRVGTAELAAKLNARGVNTEGLSGDLSQDARERILNRFKTSQISVLVATDVAARGLDIDDISHVFNFDLPPDPEVYVHRVGRTARAGKNGCAISLITPKERFTLRRIEKYSKKTIQQAQLPTVEEILHKRERSLVEKIEVWLNRGRCNKEKTLIEELTAQGHDLLDVAAAALKLAQANEKKRPIEEIRPVEEKRPERLRVRPNPKRRHESREPGMVSLSLNIGKEHGVETRHILGSLSYHANIQGQLVGKIRIQEQHTQVDVPEKLVSQVLGAKDFHIGRKKVTIERV